LSARESVAVRSYRAVVDDVERRIYRVDRWRLPMPGGIEVRAILYTVGSFVALATAAKLPLAGQLLAQLPPGLRYLALPVLIGWGLSAWRIDGRAPHYALVAACRFACGARTLAGLRPTSPVGTQRASVAALQIAPAGDEAAYRRGRVRGPARVTLRYPARLEVERSGGADVESALARAKCLRVSGVGEKTRPLSRGRELHVPDGAEVRIG